MWSKTLGDNYDLIKKARKTVIDTKDSIVNTQQYVRNRVVKHMGVLNACMRRREVVLKCEVDDRTKKKMELLDAQERYSYEYHSSPSSPVSPTLVQAYLWK